MDDEAIKKAHELINVVLEANNQQQEIIDALVASLEEYKAYLQSELQRLESTYARE